MAKRNKSMRVSPKKENINKKQTTARTQAEAKKSNQRRARNKQDIITQINIIQSQIDKINEEFEFIENDSPRIFDSILSFSFERLLNIVYVVNFEQQQHNIEEYHQKTYYNIIDDILKSAK